MATDTPCVVAASLYVQTVKLLKPSHDFEYTTWNNIDGSWLRQDFDVLDMRSQAAENVLADIAYRCCEFESDPTI